MASALASSSRYLWQLLPARSAHVSVLYQCKIRSMSYRDFFGHSPEDASAIRSSEAARLNWATREHVENKLGSSPKLRMQFSSRNYVPSVRELLRGLWSFHKDPIWLLVDQLVATGKPHNMADTCPEFPKWQHVVEARDFFAAIESLAAQGYLPLPQTIRDTAEKEEIDEEDEDDNQTGSMPTWLALYLVASKVNTRATALASVVFAISQVENTPVPLRAPLLLLVMCAVSHHRLKSQMSAIIQAFLDVFTYDRSNSADTFAASGSIIYQYNVLLTLASRFSLVPQVATHVDRLISHMHALGVPLETETATKLIRPRQTPLFLVDKVREILEYSQTSPSSALSISLTRYFSKRRDHTEAAKHVDAAQKIDMLAHAQTYILSFRDVAASLAYLRTVEARRPKELDDADYPEDGEVGQRNNLASTLSSRLRPRVESTRNSLFAPQRMRNIYTSMLFSAALSKTISTSTFIMMVYSVRAAHGSDKVLETVTLVGLLRRHAWDEARDVWDAWEKKSVELRHAAERAETISTRRKDKLRQLDVFAIQKILHKSDFGTFLVRRHAQNMAIDATALAVIVRVMSGSNTAGLLAAFDVMDNYAVKIIPNTSADQVAGLDNIQNPRPHDVRLTSRVVNCFLMRAFGRRRPDIVFRFWDNITQYYGVEVSVPTLELILRSARVAASMEQSLVSIIPHWLMRGMLRDVLPSDAFPNLGREIRWMLGPQCRPSTLWNGIPAWRVARRVFREDILFANWPWLRNVAVPAQPMRGDAATTRYDALQEVTMGEIKAEGNVQYTHLVPRPRTFREYVLLLGRVRRCSEIPEVLAWMRALEVTPTRQMLSLCLGLFAEVGMGAPADDMWLERHDAEGKVRHGGEYGKLVDWLEDWLGKDNVPNDGEVMVSLRYVRELEKNERIWS